MFKFSQPIKLMEAGRLTIQELRLFLIGPMDCMANLHISFQKKIEMESVDSIFSQKI